MAKDPDERYQNAREFAATTSQALTDAPVQRTQPRRTPPGPPAAPATFAQHRPRGHLSVKSAIRGVFQWAPSGRIARLRRSTAQSGVPTAGAPVVARRRQRALVLSGLAVVVVIAAVVTTVLLLTGPDEPPYQAQDSPTCTAAPKSRRRPKSSPRSGPVMPMPSCSLRVQPVVMTAAKG